LMAILSGISQAGNWITARKLKNVASSFQSLSYLSCVVVPLVIFGLVIQHDASKWPLVGRHPVQYLALQVALAAALFCGTVMGSLGGKLIPASLSALLNVASRMVLGYATEAIFFHGHLSFTALCGGALLVLSCVIMLCTATSPPEPPKVENKTTNDCPKAEVAEGQITDASRWPVPSQGSSMLLQLAWCEQGQLDLRVPYLVTQRAHKVGLAARDQLPRH